MKLLGLRVFVLIYPCQCFSRQGRQVRKYMEISQIVELILFLQAQHGFLSDVQNMGMYEGEMIDGQPHGNGTIIYLANDRFGRANYTGEWRFGMITGIGMMVWKSGAKSVL